MSNKLPFRILSAVCATLLLLLSLTACSSSPLTPSAQAKKEVGTVGDHTVLYEELYTAAKGCYRDGITDEELKAAVYDELTYYYTILTLCENSGVEYDEEELEDTVQAQIDAYIDQQFGGKRSSYLKALKEQGSTDHYVRFVTRVNVIYSRLEAALIAKDQLSADEATVIDYIEKNFIRTQNFMIAVNEGDDPAVVLSDAQAARDALVSGKTDLYDLIGGRYILPGGSVHEDTDPDAISTFGKGTMDEGYEQAVFALGIEEYSEVILIKDRELASGEIADCYFVAMRLPLTEELIKQNYDSLYSEYSATIINDMLVETRKGLTFVPNEYAKSLDLKSLPSIGIGTDVTLILWVTISTVAVAGITVAVLLTVRYQKNKKKKLLEEKAKRVLALRGKNDKKS